jgi:hypothetical protein
MANFDKQKIIDTTRRAVFKFTYAQDRTISPITLTAGTVTGSIFWSDLSFGLTAATSDTSRVDISKIYWSVSPIGASGSPAVAVSWARPATAITGGNVAMFLSGNGTYDLATNGINLINPLTGSARLNQIDVYNATTTTSTESVTYSVLIEVDKVSGFGVTG